MPKPLQHGDVVLVPFPFADLSGRKVRPAVIVSADPQGSDLILAFITSVLTNRSPRGAEAELLRSDPEFRVTGLKVDSLIRLDKLCTLSRAIIARRLGTLGPATQAKLTAALRTAAAFDSKGKGRVFYTSMGHREDVWDSLLFHQVILGGLAWAAGTVPLGPKSNLTEACPGVENVRAG